MLSLARLVELMEADQITLARRQRRTIAETLATTAGRLRSGGDLTARMDLHLGPAILANMKGALKLLADAAGVCAWVNNLTGSLMRLGCPVAYT